MLPNVLPLMPLDAFTIATLAETIWRHHYAEIISSEQIDYMLAQRYQPELINEQLLSSDIWWRKLVLNDVMIGFSCCMRTNKPDELKLTNCIFIVIIIAKVMAHCWWLMPLK